MKRKEALKLTFEKRHLEKELGSAKHKINELNNDFEVIYSELGNLPSSVQTFQDSLQEKEAQLESLQLTILEHVRNQHILAVQNSRLHSELQTLKNLLFSVKENLVTAHKQIKELRERSTAELQIKKNLVLEVNTILDGCSKRPELDRYIQERVAVIIQPTFRENEQLKLRVAQLNKEIDQMTAEVVAEEAIHLKDELGLIEKQSSQLQPNNTKKFFTQGTLMLDCEKIFD